jgi:hypothetical protein
MAVMPCGGRLMVAWTEGRRTVVLWVQILPTPERLMEVLSPRTLESRTAAATLD